MNDGLWMVFLFVGFFIFGFILAGLLLAGWPLRIIWVRFFDKKKYLVFVHGIRKRYIKFGLVADKTLKYTDNVCNKNISVTDDDFYTFWGANCINVDEAGNIIKIMGNKVPGFNLPAYDEFTKRLAMRPSKQDDRQLYIIIGIVVIILLAGYLVFNAMQDHKLLLQLVDAVGAVGTIK